MKSVLVRCGRCGAPFKTPEGFPGGPIACPQCRMPNSVSEKATLIVPVQVVRQPEPPASVDDWLSSISEQQSPASYLPPDPAPYQNSYPQQYASQTQQVVVHIHQHGRSQQKDVFLAFILAFLFGPLGMLYSTVAGAIVMLILTPIAFLVTLPVLGMGVLVTHAICCIWAVVAAHDSR